MAKAITFNRLGALLNAVMLTSVVLALAGLLQRFVPNWVPYYLVGACFLVALEAAFVQYTVHRKRMWLGEGVRYLVAEVAVLVVLMRVVATLGVGVGTLRQNALGWLRSPLSAFGDMNFVGCFVLAVLVALVARSAVRDMQALVPQEFERPLLPSDDRRMHALLHSDRVAALGRISRRFVLGGVLLLLALSLQVINIQRITGPPLPLPLIAGVAGLVYMICGFLLYSQARLALLQSRWWQEQAVVEQRVGQRWTRSSLLLIVLLALVLLALPRSYGMGLLDTFRSALGMVGLLIAYAGYMMLWLLSMLALLPILLLSWLTFSNEASAMPSPVLTPPPSLPKELPGTPPLLPSLIFWVCMIFLAGYAITVVAQRHPGLRRLLKLRGPLATLFGWLALLWHDASAWSRQAVQVVAQQLQRPAAHSARRSALRLAQLAPRDLVRYFYHSTLQRAAKRGITRGRAQTPYEYSNTLAGVLPEAHEDIAALTQTFVAAEYGPKPPPPEVARGARKHWERLRRQLKRES